MVAYRTFNSSRLLNKIVLYACETWSLTVREAHRLMVFENRFLRRVFVNKRDEATVILLQVAQRRVS
jgi:hypothetical protein